MSNRPTRPPDTSPSHPLFAERSEIFMVARDATAYVERLEAENKRLTEDHDLWHRIFNRSEAELDEIFNRSEAELDERNELLRRAAEPMREMVRNLVCTCAPAYRDRDLIDPSCCACEWMRELEQMERWLADYDVLTSAQVRTVCDRSGIETPDQGESIPEEGR
jgi:predicted RNase H-like nuclease (RuvC/YqgF family)